MGEDGSNGKKKIERQIYPKKIQRHICILQHYSLEWVYSLALLSFKPYFSKSSMGASVEISRRGLHMPTMAPKREESLDILEKK